MGRVYESKLKPCYRSFIIDCTAYRIRNNGNATLRLMIPVVQHSIQFPETALFALRLFLFILRWFKD